MAPAVVTGIYPGVDPAKVSLATRETLGDLAEYNEALERIQAGLGVDRPGSAAARAIYAETINDPLTLSSGIYTKGVVPSSSVLSLSAPAATSISTTST